EKALSTWRTTGPHATALFCLRILRTVCGWTRTRAVSSGKPCVTMNVNGSSIFINDFPLRYIPDTADFNSGCVHDMANARTHRQLGRILRVRSIRTRLVAVFQDPNRLTAALFNTIAD